MSLEIKSLLKRRIMTVRAFDRIIHGGSFMADHSWRIILANHFAGSFFRITLPDHSYAFTYHPGRNYEFLMQSFDQAGKTMLLQFDI